MVTKTTRLGNGGNWGGRGASAKVVREVLSAGKEGDIGAEP